VHFSLLFTVTMNTFFYNEIVCVVHNTSMQKMDVKSMKKHAVMPWLNI